ncbi:hypothetical protein [Rhodococcus erythropolis]|uniref:hypothetical protein n=1 Tax=Rhodococcus erythropolis TaxID=1833 RepID=UPI001BE4E4E1|nr:hypothetical protein [Rhodococcus erythropolis]MBT2269785.1 hypothetical protein [Rhodococcus erythropolis]
MPEIEKRSLLTRHELLSEYNFADSSERKARAGRDFIPHIRIGRRIFYRRAAVEAWLVQQERSARDVQAGDRCV